MATATVTSSPTSRIVGTLRDYMLDHETPANTRREVPKVLQEIATPAAQAVLVENVLDRDVPFYFTGIANTGIAGLFYSPLSDPMQRFVYLTLKKRF